MPEQCHEVGDVLEVYGMRGALKDSREWNGRLVKVIWKDEFIYQIQSVRPTDHFLGENIYAKRYIGASHLRKPTKRAQ